MSSAGFWRLKKLRGPGTILAAARHNRREIAAELGASASIDVARCHLNEVLTGPATAAEVAAVAKARLSALGYTLRHDAVLAVEFLFSLPPGHGLDERAYFTSCAQWAAAQFGGIDNVLALDIHRDEPAPHAHLLLMPLVDGRLQGSALVGGRQRLLALQASFYTEVGTPYGLRKGPARLTGQTKEVAAKAVLLRLRQTNDKSQQSALWAVLRDYIEDDPAPCLLALGLSAPAPAAKPLRTMAQIFTSTGRGPKREEPAKPIGFAPAEKTRSLCSVGFAEKPAPPAPAQPPAAPAAPAPPAAPAGRSVADDQTTLPEARIREDDLDPALYDPETGEFWAQPLAPARPQRRAAEAWVAQALSGLAK